MGPPYAVSATVAATPDFPTADVTSASFDVLKPNGRRVSWPAAILSQSSSSITLGHTLAQGELDLAGTWTLFARCLVPSGELRTEPTQFRVEE
jgi:hypothetical protein